MKKSPWGLGLILAALVGMDQASGQSRVVIERVCPEIDSGRFAIKRVVRESVTVEADIFADGHDLVAAEVLYRPAQDEDWQRLPMKSIGNDRWRGEFRVSEIGPYLYTVEGWVDRFGTWLSNMTKRINAGQEISIDCRIGAGLLADAALRAATEDAARLRAWARTLGDEDSGQDGKQIILGDDLAAIVKRYPDRCFAT
ncbi:MAG TPA: maltotransferase domain-containing protein, partial [Candidatus Binataceae bacterium]